MSFDAKTHAAGLFRGALAAVVPEAADTTVLLERPKQAGHGDLACNVALQLARTLQTNPRQLAERIAAALRAQPEFAQGFVQSVEIAGAGFINLRFAPKAGHAIVGRVLSEGANYGRTAPTGEKVQVEFVSANPTGPLHVGHGRGAAYGASLANVLAFAGSTITREYYINDAGRQMNILALSTWLRYLEQHGVECAFPPNAYQGDYVREMGAQFARRHGLRFVRERSAIEKDLPESDIEARLDALIERAKALLAADYEVVHRFALDAQMEDLADDLGEFGVAYDVWFSEQALYDGAHVERAVQQLGERGHLYEKDGALWFRSTAFGDEKDRVVKRENGQFTYFASDIAYHLNKFERGFDRIINVWGADHHGYIPRVKGALAALGLPVDRLSVALVQFAVLYRGGEKVSMSTRAGEFVTLRELRREVGNDAARFFYVLRKSDQHLDFDLDLAKSESNDNPVYYVQYAHARLCSVFAQSGADPQAAAQAALDPLTHARELVLMQRLAEFPETVMSAARELAPHLIAFYLRELAADLHSYYNAERILAEDTELARARLALCAATRQVLANGLALLGVSAPERM